jgi:hypothetical protein
MHTAVDSTQLLAGPDRSAQCCWQLGWVGPVPGYFLAGWDLCRVTSWLGGTCAGLLLLFGLFLLCFALRGGGAA